MATHEVADCGADHIVAPAWAKWEPCVVVQKHKESYDVRIVSDNAHVPDVPMRFVRPIRKITVGEPTSAQRTPAKRKRSYGWTESEMQKLESAKVARMEALSRGEPAKQQYEWIRKCLLNKGVSKTARQIKRQLRQSKTPTPSPPVEATPDRDLTLAQRNRLRQLLNGRALRRSDRLLKQIASQMGLNEGSVWRAYRRNLPKAAPSRRGIRRCHFKATGVQCQHTNKDEGVTMFNVRLEPSNKAVLLSMGYSVQEFNTMVVKGRKRVNCCGCHQDGQPGAKSLPGSRICRHTLVRTSTSL